MDDMDVMCARASTRMRPVTSFSLARTVGFKTAYLLLSMQDIEDAKSFRATFTLTMLIPSFQGQTIRRT